MNTLCRICVLSIFVLFSVYSRARAQDWGSYAWTLNASGWVSADNDYLPMPFCGGGLFSPQMDSYLGTSLFTNVWGHQVGRVEIRQKSENTGANTCEPRPTYVQTHSAGWVFIDGLQTNSVNLSYGINAVVYANPDATYQAIASDTLDFTVLLDVTNAPNGFPITIYIDWDHFGGISGPYGSENLIAPAPPLMDLFEDSCWTTAQLFINGAEQFTGRFDFSDIPPGPPSSGWNQLKNQSSVINTTVGSSLMTIQVILQAYAKVQFGFPTNPPPFPTALPDENSGSQHGNIRLSIDVPNPLTPPDSLYTSSWVDFTVDIGGDAELSDSSHLALNETFDPADIYVWHSPPMPPGGADGNLIDDIILYGVDIFPNTPDGPPSITGAPVGSGFFSPDLYLDIDGHDMLDFYLTDFGYGPDQNPIGYFLSGCVNGSDNLFISFDDDNAENWSAPSSVPQTSTSPFGNQTYGKPTTGDEIIGLSIITLGMGSPVVFQYPFQSEDQLHPNLMPGPLPGVEFADDDVDEIDIHDAQCNVWYFSVDHEASYGLDPGTVYMKVGGGPGGGFRPVVEPDPHLGIHPGVDLDAIEFCWIFSNALGGQGLALLFSVDDDDPLTPQNESGGLDPGMIYFSFLDGNSYPLLASSLAEDIDALASWGTPLYAGYVNPAPPCLAVSDLVIKWLDNTNVQLTFTAPQTGTYLSYFTTNNNLFTNPPSPGWNLFNTTTAAAGQQVSITNNHSPSLGNFKKFVVVSQCP